MAISAKSFRELRLEGMRRDFGGLNAVKDISLTIKRGEFIASAGAFGLRQVDGPELLGRAAAAFGRQHLAG